MLKDYRKHCVSLALSIEIGDKLIGIYLTYHEIYGHFTQFQYFLGSL